MALGRTARDLRQERSLLCVQTDGPRIVAERFACAQRWHHSPTAPGSDSLGGTPSRRRDSRVCLVISRPPKTSRDDLESKRDEN
jgi:hypothetical protein